MAGRVVAGLAVLVAAALSGCSSVDSDFHIDVPFSGGGPTSFLQMSGSAYIIDGTYVGETSIDSVGNDVGLIVEVDHPEFLGDDSPGVQEPPPVIASGDEIVVITSRFPDGVDLAGGERVVLIVAHNANFDPPWNATAIGSGTGPSFGLVGDDTDPLMIELQAVAQALDVDLETAFVTLGRELLVSDELMREGSSRDDSLGPALRAASGQAQSATDATGPQAVWEALDPLTRALQRGTAPDDLLDTLPEMSVVYTISGDVHDAYPGSLVQVRNNLGVTSSIDAALFHGTDNLFGSPGNRFEVTLVVEDPARAMLIGDIPALRWENEYAISVEVSLDPNGHPIATAEPMTRSEFAAQVEEPTELEVIVLPDEQGRFSDDLLVGCPGGPAFPASVLNETPLFDGAKLPSVEAALQEFLADEEGQFWPQDGWQILYETESFYMLAFLHEGRGAIEFVGLELEDDEWGLGFLGGRGSCDLEVVLPVGLNAVDWFIDPEGEPRTPESTSIEVLVTERACASGKPVGDRLVGPEIVMTDTEVLIAFAATAQSGAQFCPANPPQAVVVELPEPLGDREVVDGLDLGMNLAEFLS